MVHGRLSTRQVLACYLGRRSNFAKLRSSSLVVKRTSPAACGTRPASLEGKHWDILGPRPLTLWQPRKILQTQCNWQSGNLHHPPSTPLHPAFLTVSCHWTCSLPEPWTATADIPHSCGQTSTKNQHHFPHVQTTISINQDDFDDKYNTIKQ